MPPVSRKAVFIAVFMLTPDAVRGFNASVPWRPLTDEGEALAFGRWYTSTVGAPTVADTILGELRREICDRHPLAGVSCRPVAWESWSKKDFLFLTARSDMPVTLVHFTWAAEHEPEWPFVVPYRSLRHFTGRERNWAVEARVLVQRWWIAFARGW
jgi:hypothetical protein